MCVFLERCRRIDEAQLPRHAEVHDQLELPFQSDEDVLAAPADRFDPQTGYRVDEDLWLGMPDDRRKKKFATKDGAADQVRPKIVDDRFDFG
jgi:hypothetical protein